MLGLYYLYQFLLYLISSFMTEICWKHGPLFLFWTRHLCATIWLGSHVGFKNYPALFVLNDMEFLRAIDFIPIHYHKHHRVMSYSNGYLILFHHYGVFTMCRIALEVIEDILPRVPLTGFKYDNILLFQI